MIIKYFIIANPSAGPAKINHAVDLLVFSLKERNHKFKLNYTKSRGDAGELAGAAISQGYSHIITVGGDGTTSEVAGQIVNKRVALGVIPAGSGNDFPKAMGIPLNIKDAVDTVFSGISQPADIANIGSRSFVNGLGIGMDGAVAKMFGKLKSYFGQSGYIVGAVLEAFRFKAFETITEINGESSRGNLLLFGASNGPFQGGKFNLAPEASIFDGLLDFHFVSEMNPFERLLKIPKVLNGERNVSKVDLVKSKELEFETFIDLPSHIDGEAFTLGKGKHKIEILENGINLIVPAK